jgi:acyl carrier protein
MDRLIRILNEQNPEVDFGSSERLIDDSIIDSFDIVTIIAEINDEFDVMIPVEEIVPENFNSAKAMYALIERLQEK